MKKQNGKCAEDEAHQSIVNVLPSERPYDDEFPPSLRRADQQTALELHSASYHKPEGL
jgi:hypothetical protein